MAYANRLSELRGNLSQAEFSKIIGMSQQNYGKYENGKSPLKSDLIEMLCKKFGVSAEWLLCMTDKRSGIEQNVVCSDTWCPHLGVIAAGSPKEAIEQVDERSWCPPGLLEKYPHVFTLTASGDSMNLLYPDGRLIYVDPDDTEIENDKQYAVLVNGFDSTVKTLFKKWDTVILHPESTNPVHKDMVIDQSDPDAPYFRVVGKVVWDAAPMKW